MSAPARLATRRLLLTVTILASGCGRGTDPGGAPSAEGPPGSLARMKSGAVVLNLLQAQSGLTTGKALFTFGLSDIDGKLATEGNASVWVARDETSRASGPYPAKYHAFSALEADHEHGGEGEGEGEVTGF